MHSRLLRASVFLFCISCLFKTLSLSRVEANRDRPLGRSFTIFILCLLIALCESLQAPHRSYPSISAATAFRKVPGTMACFYAENDTLSHVIRRGSAGYGCLDKKPPRKNVFVGAVAVSGFKAKAEGVVIPHGPVVDSPWPVHTLDESVAVLRSTL